MGTYGIKQKGYGLDVGFITQGPYAVNVGSHSYLLKDDKEYKLFRMLEKEISAGAAFGTGYCDGQCARDLK